MLASDNWLEGVGKLVIIFCNRQCVKSRKKEAKRKGSLNPKKIIMTEEKVCQK